MNGGFYAQGTELESQLAVFTWEMKPVGLQGHDDRAAEVTFHDWSVAYPFDKRNASGTGYLPGGTAWYRKHFILPDDVAGKRVRVCFGGVYKHARVWVNSNYLGQRAYGYASFGYDVSAFVRPGENVISVRVEHEEVADSRWFTGSGIYRDVTLEISDPRGFLPQGIFVTTETVNAEEQLSCASGMKQRARSMRRLL